MVIDMEFLDKSTIEINRELSKLDSMSLEFTDILEKYSEYAIVGGYVAILLGRSRASEDIDVITQKVDHTAFKKFYAEIKENDFHCLNTKKVEKIFGYLESGTAVRFAKKEKIVPNIELKWTNNRLDRLTIEEKITVKLPDGEIYIGPLELQVAFKEEVLKSPKDIEDANHIRDVAGGYLNEESVNDYKEMLHEFY